MSEQDTYKIWELAEAMAAGSLFPAEKKALEARLAGDEVFAAEFAQAQTLLSTFEQQRQTTQMRSKLSRLHNKLKVGTTAPPVTTPPELNSKPLFRRVLPLLANWRTAAVAASAALLLSITSLLSSTSIKGGSRAQYRQLSREIAAVKRSQSQLIDNQNKLISSVKAARKAALTEAVKLSGTGFAINNAGYVVTAYHVAQDADSVYIQTSKGDYYKATLIAFNPQSDVAVLRVDDRSFRFASVGEVPYSFSPRKSGIGARIYTLGFPQDEVVYSEGYVSAYNGYRGDSAQYRLSLPAEPGASGAPVLDAQGVVLGIVAGDQSEAAGATYAVSSKELLRLLKSLPKEQQPALPAGNKLGGLSREQQLEKLQAFTCIVRVYKP
jgi:S1-C subfamily serine protease